MEDFNLKPKEKTELSVQKQQQIERELIGKILPHNGHTVFEICKESGKIEKATYIEKPFVFGQENINNEVLYREGYDYVSALNKKNALKKWKKGLTGSKDVNDKPLSFDWL